MIFIKLFLIGCFVMLPSCSMAQEKWAEGDEVAAFFVCKTEKDIMDLVLADSKSQEAFAGKIVEKKFNQDCIKIFPPMQFIVSEIIGSYKDHRKVENTILKIQSPANEMFVGYVLVQGIPATHRNTSL
jgi:hypothetical protein